VGEGEGAGSDRRLPLPPAAAHTFASHFAKKGGNIYALAVILGHSNPAMTIERYAKLSPKYVRDQAATMDKKPYDGHRMDTKRVSSEKGSL
jgi:integrase